ncbi:hypothetical protein [Streptomyces lichenis]|uniref:Uncharacterized protein n=1 Tax=Streptomyces lichenis TaxID=2306967 RepID=A0ABT0I556_9ACTN|nr:hypothetical protein [Streptomyces lichenis]MCK8676442.1 hypothetical protein [Streptomyces lichenis]
MSVGGVGIPRLQELTYIEMAARAVAAGEPFERVRLAIVNQAEHVARANDRDGSFDVDKWIERHSNPLQYVHNTVDVLKELMRLGWLERHALPSSPRSAHAHADATFTMTETGRAWTDLVVQDPYAGYHALAGALIDAHPQFEGFLRLVGARPDSVSDHLSVPLLRYRDEHEDHGAFLTAFISHTILEVADGTLGWTAAPETIEDSLRTYVERAVHRAAVRAEQRAQEEKERQAKEKKPRKPGSGQAERRWEEIAAQVPRPQAWTRKRYAALCEEAAIRLAVTASGCPMDYISHELLRRWSRFLGLANFSYYVPGPPSLRLWATGRVTGRGKDVSFIRSVGAEARIAALRALPRVWRAESERAGGATYCPVWRIRAAVCWDQRISDDEFDAAITSAFRGDVAGLGFRVHLDEASHVRTPGSVKPLVLSNYSGMPKVFHVMSVFTDRHDEEVHIR